MTVKLVQLTDAEQPQFEEYFDEIVHAQLEDVAPRVIQGQTNVLVGDTPISAFDAAFLDIPVKNATFGRVLLEMIEEKHVPTNYPSTGYFIMAKKNYLYYVLHDKGIAAPKTVVVATEQAARHVERELKGPLIGRKLENLEETENRQLETVDEISGFAEGSEYEEDVLLFHEFRSGDKYRCMVAGDRIISLQDGSDDWRFSTDGLKYTNISTAQKEAVTAAVNAIGTPVAEVLLRGDQVYDVHPNPDLELYTDVSGKNAFKSVAKVLKDE